VCGARCVAGGPTGDSMPKSTSCGDRGSFFLKRWNHFHVPLNLSRNSKFRLTDLCLSRTHRFASMLCRSYLYMLIIFMWELTLQLLKGLPGPYIKWFLDKLGHEVGTYQEYRNKSFLYCGILGLEQFVGSLR
jgi:hypothetical protein